MRKPSESQFIPVLVFLWNWRKPVKLGSNIPTHGHRYTESHRKFSAPHVKSNDILIQCKGHLRIELYIFGYLGNLGEFEKLSASVLISLELTIFYPSVQGFKLLPIMKTLTKDLSLIRTCCVIKIVSDITFFNFSNIKMLQQLISCYSQISPHP